MADNSGALDASQYNMRSPGVKRLMKEAAELRNPTDMYFAQPLKDNLFEWHFTVRGPADTDFDGGIYHGRILLPVDYPMKPPSVILLTPNGRFQLNQKICLSISGHHPESWQPSWSIRTALLALIGFMPTHSAGALGSLEYPPAERKKLAKLSRDWVCAECGLRMCDALASGSSPEGAGMADEARRLATQISFKNEFETRKPDTAKTGVVETPSPQQGDHGDSPGITGPPTGTTGTPAEAPEDASSADNLTSEPEESDLSSLPQQALARNTDETRHGQAEETSSAPDTISATTPDQSQAVGQVTSRDAPTTQVGYLSWELFAIFLLSIAFAALLYRRLSGMVQFG